MSLGGPNDRNLALVDGRLEQRPADPRAELTTWLFLLWLGTVATSWASVGCS